MRQLADNAVPSELRPRPQPPLHPAGRADPTPDPGPRPHVHGKSLWLAERKLHVRGVTYGPFGSDRAGGFDPATAEHDFAEMARHGINAIRLYVPPERWLLNLAHEHGLHAMVGIPWEQHIAFLDTGADDRIERSLREALAAVAGHPAILCYAIGNEIPASIVRWHGRRRVERFLARLNDAAKQTDPGALTTYVNFPPTEYLRLPSFDIVAFNVYLERREMLERYLARLQNLADDRPLILAELGLDSRRNGEIEQARSLGWQLDVCAKAGCAGSFVFAWTDQWHRGGHDILDWDFGLTSRERRAKPALAAVADAYRDPAPPLEREAVPRVSIVICTHNGAATLEACLRGAVSQTHPDFEVIVVDDGSTDGTAEVARAHEEVRVISTPNRGLSAARNTGMEAASGSIVAYTDDDAVPDPDWLRAIVAGFELDGCVAVGGPNMPPPDSNAVAQCVANAPGGPTHVLTSDREAEHIPGCNMAIAKDALVAIGGFDPRFRAAGDDVDVCWRLLEAGGRIAFSPGAVVMHRRRDSVRGYLRQQRSYGQAEALLERKHPERYSPAGHVTWRGRLYGNGAAQHRGGWRWHVYYGGWGTAFYQSLYGPRNGLLESLPLMPEWYLTIAFLAVLSALGALWAPLLGALPLLLAATVALVADAGLGAARARFLVPGRTWRLRALTAFLYLAQPLARLRGRLGHGLTPWRRRGARTPAPPLPRRWEFWCESWQGTEERMRAIIDRLHMRGASVHSGGDWDRWDLQVLGGLLGVARLRMGIEEHGAGHQLVRLRVWPRPRIGAWIALALLAALAALAAISDAGAAAVLLALAAAVLLRTLYECGLATSAIRQVLTSAIAGDSIESPEASVAEDTEHPGADAAQAIPELPVRPPAREPRSWLPGSASRKKHPPAAPRPRERTGASSGGASAGTGADGG